MAILALILTSARSEKADAPTTALILKAAIVVFAEREKSYRAICTPAKACLETMTIPGASSDVRMGAALTMSVRVQMAGQELIATKVSSFIFKYSQSVRDWQNHSLNLKEVA